MANAATDTAKLATKASAGIIADMSSEIPISCKGVRGGGDDDTRVRIHTNTPSPRESSLAEDRKDKSRYQLQMQLEANEYTLFAVPAAALDVDLVTCKAANPKLHKKGRGFDPSKDTQANCGWTSTSPG